MLDNCKVTAKEVTYGAGLNVYMEKCSHRPEHCPEIIELYMAYHK